MEYSHFIKIEKHYSERMEQEKETRTAKNIGRIEETKY